MISYRLLEARQNLINMMKKNGYITAPFENIGVYEMNAKYEANDLDMLFEKNDDKSSSSSSSSSSIVTKILVRFCVKDKLNVKMLEEIREDVFLLDPKLATSDLLMMVTLKDPNDTMKAHLKHIWNKDATMVSIISLNRLQFNILDHHLVPVHTIVNKKQLEEECFQVFNIRTIEELPDISRFDPVSIAIGIVPGEVCRIDRPSKTAITSVYYRKCINE